MPVGNNTPTIFLILNVSTIEVVLLAEKEVVIIVGGGEDIGATSLTLMIYSECYLFGCRFWRSE